MDARHLRKALGVVRGRPADAIADTDALYDDDGRLWGERRRFLRVMNERLVSEALRAGWRPTRMPEPLGRVVLWSRWVL
jgi:hypothetical protein